MTEKSGLIPAFFVRQTGLYIFDNRCMIKIKMIIEEIEMKKFEETELKRLIAGCKERITLFDTSTRGCTPGLTLCNKSGEMASKR